MLERCSFDYAVIRIVPRVEREEFLNAGVILYSATQGFLKASLALERERLKAFAPWLGNEAIEALEENLKTIPLICEGGTQAGPAGLMEQRARFHWLVAPRSTIIQTSPVHSGVGCDLDESLEHLMDCMVRPPQVTNSGITK